MGKRTSVENKNRITPFTFRVKDDQQIELLKKNIY